MGRSRRKGRLPEVLRDLGPEDVPEGYGDFWHGEGGVVDPAQPFLDAGFRPEGEGYVRLGVRKSDPESRRQKAKLIRDHIRGIDPTLPLDEEAGRFALLPEEYEVHVFPRGDGQMVDYKVFLDGEIVHHGINSDGMRRIKLAIERQIKSELDRVRWIVETQKGLQGEIEIATGSQIKIEDTELREIGRALLRDEDHPFLDVVPEQYSFGIDLLEIGEGEEETDLLESEVWTWWIRSPSGNREEGDTPSESHAEDQVSRAIEDAVQEAKEELGVQLLDG